jgi:hypothetical protein
VGKGNVGLDDVLNICILGEKITKKKSSAPLHVASKKQHIKLGLRTFLGFFFFGSNKVLPRLPKLSIFCM